MDAALAPEGSARNTFAPLRASAAAAEGFEAFTATRIAVSPRLFSSSGLAPTERRYSTISAMPMAAAMWSGASPFASRAFTSALLLSISLTPS